LILVVGSNYWNYGIGRSGKGWRIAGKTAARNIGRDIERHGLIRAGSTAVLYQRQSQHHETKVAKHIPSTMTKRTWSNVFPVCECEFGLYHLALAFAKWVSPSRARTRASPSMTRENGQALFEKCTEICDCHTSIMVLYLIS
jgi:hypothetical protein